MAINREINPFLNNLSVPYIEVIKTVKFINGELTKDSYELEAEQYVRLYSKKSNREFIFNELSIYARDMVLSIMYMINYDYQYIILNYDKFNKLHGGSYSRRRYDDTVRELHKKAVIDLKDKTHNQYWYNPALFAGGNRITMYPECMVKVSTRLMDGTASS
jgi:hypothetical protein